MVNLDIGDGGNLTLLPDLLLLPVERNDADEGSVLRELVCFLLMVGELNRDGKDVGPEPTKLFG